MKIDMVYVAVDPNLPDRAYAICESAPRDANWNKLTADVVSKWIKKGSLVMLVPRKIGYAMRQRGEESL